MAEQPPPIDTDILDRLIEIRARQRQLDEFCRRAEELRERVDPAVYQRVIDDYRRRHTTLEEDAGPLKAKAREQYRTLQTLYREVRSRRESARLAKEELEFRHAIGELGEDALAEQMSEPVRVLEACDAEIAALDAQHARFVEALAGEPLEALEAAVPAAAPAPTPRPEAMPVGVVPAPASEALPEDLGEATRLVTLEPEPTEPVAAHVAPGVSPGPVAEPATAPVPSLQPADEVEKTMLLPEGVLVAGEETGTPVEHPLGMLTYIGRADENHIRVLRPGVSRRHAVVVAGPTGFTIRDLKSQNGTFVNGEPVTERALADGDRIVIGDAAFVFRMRSPVAGRLAPPLESAGGSADGGVGERTRRGRRP